MIVAITDGRANISLKRSTDPEAAVATDAPKPSAQELKVRLSFVIWTDEDTASNLDFQMT